MDGKCSLSQEGKTSQLAHSSELAVSFRDQVRVQDFMKEVDDFTLKLQEETLSLRSDSSLCY